MREEIELAKAEIELKAKQLARGAAVGAAAGFFVFLGLIFAFHALAWGINDVLDSLWLGFLITTALLFVLAGVAGLHRLQELPGRRAADARHGDRGGEAHEGGDRAPRTGDLVAPAEEVKK